MIHTRRILTNATTSVGQVVISGISLFLLYKFLLETIGVTQLGVWSLVLAISSMVQIGNFGLTGAIVKNIASYDARGDKHSIALAIQTAVITVAILSLVLINCAYPGARYYFGFAMEGEAYQDALEVLPMALIAFWVFMVTSVYQSGMYGCQLIVKRNGVLIAESISHLVLCMLLAPRYGLFGLAYARVAQNIVTLVVSIALLKSHLPALPLFPHRWDRGLFKEMVGYATSFQVIALLLMLIDPITKALLSRFGSVSFVGYYEMANKVVQLFRSLIVNANQVLVPAFANLKELQPQKVSELYLKSTRLVTYLALPGFGLLGICAPLVSELWVGHYEPAFIWSVALLCAGWLGNALSAPAYFASMGTGEMRINVVSHVVMTLLNILLAWSLGQLFGGLGVVAGYAIAVGVGGLMLNVLYCRHYSILLSSLFSEDDRILAYYFLAALISVSLGWLTIPTLWDALLPSLKGPAAGGSIITNYVTILVYIAIMSFPMWHHSMRSNLQSLASLSASADKGLQIPTN